jgi:hypothetical protein
MEIIMSQWQTNELNFGAETTPSNAKQHDGARGAFRALRVQSAWTFFVPLECSPGPTMRELLLEHS